MNMIYRMTTRTSNTIESLLSLPFHIFYYIYNSMEEELDNKNKQ